MCREVGEEAWCWEEGEAEEGAQDVIWLGGYGDLQVVSFVFGGGGSETDSGKHGHGCGVGMAFILFVKRCICYDEAVHSFPLYFCFSEAQLGWNGASGGMRSCLYIF